MATAISSYIKVIDHSKSASIADCKVTALTSFTIGAYIFRPSAKKLTKIIKIDKIPISSFASVAA